VSEKNEPLTEEQKKQLRRHVRRHLRSLGFDVPDKDQPPMIVEVVDDDGTIIKTEIK